MKKAFMYFIIIYLLFGCSRANKQVDVNINYNSENKYLSIENKSTNKVYGFHNIGYSDLFLNYGYKEPIYCVDSLNKILYLYDIGSLRGLRIYDLSNDVLLKEVNIQPFREEQFKINIYCLKDIIIIKSNSRFDIWDKEFLKRISLRDSIYNNYPICGRYTLDYLPIIKNDTLFLNVKYEGGIMDSLVHESNYIYDLKKNEFITKLKLCDKILSRGVN
jgi:hypothetical protein